MFMFLQLTSLITQLIKSAPCLSLLKLVYTCRKLFDGDIHAVTMQIEFLDTYCNPYHVEYRNIGGKSDTLPLALCCLKLAMDGS